MAYAAEGTHLIWRSPVLSTRQQGLLPSDCTENSTAQALMFRHLPENCVLQRSFSSIRTVPTLPTPKKGTDTFPGVQILLPLFSVPAAESDVLLVHSRRNIYPKTESMDSFRGTEEEFHDLVAFPAPPLTYWSLWSLSFSSKTSNGEMRVLLQSACTKPQQGVEDRGQEEMLTVQWWGVGRGDNPKGIMKELPASPGNKPEAHTLCSWCSPRMTSWSPFNTQWTESRPEGQLGIRKHLEDRPGNWKMGHIPQCKPPQSKGIRQGLCWDSFKVRTCPQFSATTILLTHILPEAVVSQQD